jgi:hypothetical protein
MTSVDAPAPRLGHGIFMRYLRQYCLLIAVMMVFSVSVHPALAMYSE